MVLRTYLVICIRSIKKQKLIQKSLSLSNKTKTNTEISFSFLLSLFYSIPSLSPYRLTDSLTHSRRNDNTRFAWAGGTCPRFAWAGRILNFFLGFQIPPIFCKCISTSKRILNFFLGFQIPPIFCISHLAPPSKRILKFFLGFQIPPIFYDWKKKRYDRYPQKES